MRPVEAFVMAVSLSALAAFNGIVYALLLVPM